MLRSGKVVRAKKYARPRCDSDTSLDEDVISTLKVSRSPREVFKSTNRNYRRSKPRKVVVCEVCSKVFPNADDYNAHSFIHIGESEIRNTGSAGSRSTKSSKSRNTRKPCSTVSLQCRKSSKSEQLKQQNPRKKSLHSTVLSADISSAVSNIAVGTENCSSELKRRKMKRKKSDSKAKPNDYLKKNKLNKSNKKASHEKLVEKIGLFESLAGDVSERELLSDDLQDGNQNLNEEMKITKTPSFSSVPDHLSPKASRDKSSNVSLSNSNVSSIRKSSDDTTRSGVDLIRSHQSKTAQHSLAVEDNCNSAVPAPICDVPSSEQVQKRPENDSNCKITSVESGAVCVEADTLSNHNQSIAPSNSNQHRPEGSSLSSSARDNFYERLRTAIESSKHPATPDSNVCSDNPETMNFTSKSLNFLKSKRDSEFETKVGRAYRTPLPSRKPDNPVESSPNQLIMDTTDPWVIHEKDDCDKVHPMEISETCLAIHSNEPVASSNISNVQQQENANFERDQDLGSADTLSQSDKDFTSAKISSKDNICSTVSKTMASVEDESNCSPVDAAVYRADRLDMRNSEICVSENICDAGSFDGLPYECRWCGRSFNSESVLASHWSVHTGCKRYVCRICGRSFTSKRSLRDHKEDHKIMDLSLKSAAKENAAKVVKSNEVAKSVERDSRPIKKFVCLDCGKRFSTKIRFLHHQTVVTCRICKITFRCHVSYLLHNSELHETACYICGETLFNYKFLTNHIKSHTAEKVNVCIECGDLFATRKELLNHFPTHGGLGKHVCEFCGFPFLNREDFRSHQKRKKHSTLARELRSIASYANSGIRSSKDIAAVANPANILESHG